MTSPSGSAVDLLGSLFCILLRFPSANPQAATPASETLGPTQSRCWSHPKRGAGKPAPLRCPCSRGRDHVCLGTVPGVAAW